MTARQDRKDPPPFRFSPEHRAAIEDGPLKFVKSKAKRRRLLCAIQSGLGWYRVARQHGINWQADSRFAPQRKRLEAWADMLEQLGAEVGPNVFVNRAIQHAYGDDYGSSPAECRHSLEQEQARLLRLARGLREQVGYMQRPRGGQCDDEARWLLWSLMSQWRLITDEEPSAGSGSRFVILLETLRELGHFHGSRKLVAALLKLAPAPSNVIELHSHRRRAAAKGA